MTTTHIVLLIGLYTINLIVCCFIQYRDILDCNHVFRRGDALASIFLSMWGPLSTLFAVYALWTTFGPLRGFWSRPMVDRR